MKPQALGPVPDSYNFQNSSSDKHLILCGMGMVKRPEWSEVCVCFP
jgi:hypothetical protein